MTVPERCVLLELMPALQVRLLGMESQLVVVPTVSSYEEEIEFAKVEFTGKKKQVLNGKELEVRVTNVQRKAGSVLTYWHDVEGRLCRINQSGQALVIRRLAPK